MEIPIRRKLLACFVSLCLTAPCLAGEDYCSLKCHEGEHTMCRFKQMSMGRECVDYVNATLAEGEKKDILSIHNAMRNDVAQGNAADGLDVRQPPAADMMQLVWDEELATVAQRWADQCVYDHDLCRRVARFQVGQNVAMRTGANKFTSEDLYENVQMWFDEVDKLNPSTIKKYDTSESDHYTQLMWASTGAVGCGASIYRSGDAVYTQLLVCNYGPAGNVPGRPVYTEGRPCSACPRGTSCSADHRGLCFSPDYAYVARDGKPASEPGHEGRQNDNASAVSSSVPTTCKWVLLTQFAACWLVASRAAGTPLL